MKTEQEQIEKMARSMCGYCSTDGKCAVSKNGREPDICANVDTQHCLYKEYAERLIESGYGNISEHKAEIERLRTTLWQCNTELNSALESLKSQCREIGKLKAEVKQAKIDVLNKLKDIVFDYLGVKNIKEAEALSLLDSTLTYDVITCGIDEIIKEVQNGKDKS